MLPNYQTPYRHAADALRCQEKSRVQTVVPNWMNPYRMPLTQACDCPPGVGCVGKPELALSKLLDNTHSRARSGW